MKRKKIIISTVIASIIVFYLLFIRGYSPEFVIRRDLLLSLQLKAAFSSEIKYRGTDTMYGEGYVVYDADMPFYYLGKNVFFAWRVLGRGVAA